MHLIAPLYAKPYINREFTAPNHSTTLFSPYQWLIALIFSITMHLIIMHGLPWFNQSNNLSTSTQSVTVDFKTIPSPTPAKLPEIAPVPEPHIEPLKVIQPITKKAIKPKPTLKHSPKPEPILQSEKVAAPEDFAIAAKNTDIEKEDTTKIVEIETITEPVMPTTSFTNQPITTAQTSPVVPKIDNNAASQQNVFEQPNINKGALDAYGQKLQRLCEQHKKYPAIAIRRNLEGAGSVLVQFNKLGKVLSITIEDSTGQSSLDKQAIKMVEKSIASMPLPNNLKGQVLTLSVPISFKLY